MSSTYYMIVDGYDNQIADGISEEIIEEVAQDWADRLGHTVYYVESLGEDGEYIAVEPSAR